MARITVSGLHDLQARLLALPEALAERALRPATAAAARVIRDEAVDSAPVYHGDVQQGHPPPGTLRRSIFHMYLPERSSAHRVVFGVGVRRKDAGDPTGKGAFYWHMVEYGTSKMPAHPFLRPAYEKKVAEAFEVMKQRLAAEISKEVGR